MRLCTNLLSQVTSALKCHKYSEQQKVYLNAINTQNGKKEKKKSA